MYRPMSASIPTSVPAPINNYIYIYIYDFVVNSYTYYNFWTKIKEMSKQCILFAWRIYIYHFVIGIFCGFVLWSDWFPFSWRAENQLNFILRWCRLDQEVRCYKSMWFSRSGVLPLASLRLLPPTHLGWLFMSNQDIFAASHEPFVVNQKEWLYPCTYLGVSVWSLRCPEVNDFQTWSMLS